MDKEYIETLILKDIETNKTYSTTEYKTINIEPFKSIDTYTFYKILLEIKETPLELLEHIKESQILNLYIIRLNNKNTTTFQATINVHSIEIFDNKTYLEILMTGLATYTLAKH